MLCEQWSMRGSESELFRDKIEVSLDGKQIFYLFFGGAVIASMVFVLGVMVGRRVEARSFAGNMSLSAAHDPLAALDKLDTVSTSKPELAFPVALRSDVTATPPIGELDDSLAAATDIEDEEARAAAEQAAVAAANREAADRKVAEKQLKLEKKTLKSAQRLFVDAVKLRDKLIKKETKRALAEAKREAKRKAADDAKAAKEATEEAELAAKDDTEAENAAKKPKSRRSRFTLQLSSFQDRTEADAFFTEIRDSGYQPFIVEAEVPEKGLWYRVRLGKYDSYEDAVAAKEEFEKRQKIIAYVTRIKR